MKTKKIILLIIVTFISALFPIVSVFADNKGIQENCSSIICTKKDGSEYVYPESVRAACGCSTSTITEDPLPKTIANVLNGIIVSLGILAVIFIVIGGVRYMTSTGDPQKAKIAKDTILYACIGLIICALAFALTNFIIGIINKA